MRDEIGRRKNGKLAKLKKSEELAKIESLEEPEVERNRNENANRNKKAMKKRMK